MGGGDGWWEELINFWWPWSHFQGHRRLKSNEKCLICTVSWRDWWILISLRRYIIDWVDFMTLTPFENRSQEVKECWKMPCLHSVSWRDEWILTEPAQLYLLEIQKSWLDFGDLDSVFKATGGPRMLKNALSALLKGLMDFYQTCTDKSLGDAKELIRFWWPWLHFQGHRK